MTRLRNLKYLARPSDMILLLRVLACLAAVRAAIHRTGILDLLAWLDPGAGRRLEISRIDQVNAFTNFGVYRLMRSPNPCLYRSLVLFRFLRMMGLNVRIAFAVKKGENHLEGHAWVIRDGKPFLDQGGPAADYEPVLIYPGDDPEKSESEPCHL